jgi:uncharacterized protein (TIGR02301 family)
VRLALAVALCLSVAAAAAQQRPRGPAQAPPLPAQPEPPETPLLYEPQLLKLTETLGVIAFMSQLCGDAAGESWRERAAQLIEAEAATSARRERLAGAYNRGFVGHQAAHRACSERSRVVIERKMREAREIAQDLANRFGG